MSYSEEILEAAPRTTATVWVTVSNLTKHPKLDEQEIVVVAEKLSKTHHRSSPMKFYTGIHQGWSSTKTYINQLCANTRYRLKDLLGAMNHRNGWRARVKDLRAIR